MATTYLEKLDKLVPQYAQTKQQADIYKKQSDKENAEIKSIMTSLALQHYEAGGYKVVRSVQKRESINEEQLIEIAHKYNIPDVIKTKEYIDFDALEKAIYDGNISQDVLLEMDKAKDVKHVVQLRISKLEEKK